MAVMNAGRRRVMLSLRAIIVGISIVSLLLFLVMTWPRKPGFTDENVVVLQVGALKSALSRAAENRGGSISDLVNTFPRNTNGISVELREFVASGRLIVDASGNIPARFFRDRKGNYIRLYRKEDLPDGAVRDWMRQLGGDVFVWGVGDNERDEWGGGDDVRIDFERLSVVPRLGEMER